ncbi:G-type lectin S-receptor-like serine/threonine-protein kinase, partial [Thalictrum thalictroides]
MNGNLHLYRWDNDVNGSQQWVPEWAAVSNPCDIAGTCGNGICNLDGSKTNSSCRCLPGTSQVPPGIQCVANSALTGNCDYSLRKNSKSQYRIIYGLKEETAYCWILRFGGFEDPAGSTLFVKVDNNGSTPPNTRNVNASKRSSSYCNKRAMASSAIILPGKGKMIRVLSIDGGGVKGLIPGVMLEFLEAKLQ